MALLEDLDAFYLEHRRCGELEGDVTPDEPFRVVMDCSCGARFARPLSGADDPPWRPA